MVEKVNRLNKLIKLIGTSAIVLGAMLKTAVADNGVVLISDTETTDYLAEIVRPLFASANVSFDENKIFIVNNSSLNAFVSDGNYLFVHTGTLISADDTNELAGILAHETGHIAGGHIVRQKLKMENMHYMMLGSLIAAGATAVSTGRGDAAVAVILGSQSSALNSMIHYQLEEERSADESAIKLLAQTQQSTAGLERFMGKIRKKNALEGIEEDVYFRTHPMTSERISHFKEAAKENKFSAKNHLDEKYKFVKAKISAFLENPSVVWHKYPETQNDEATKYAHAILYFREGKVDKAINNIDALIQAHPQNPYFYEQKGQFMFESGKIKESIKAYKEALERYPNAPMIQVSLAMALLEDGEKDDKSNVKEAISLLRQSLVKVKNPQSWQLLARAYDMVDEKAGSYYATAEFNYAIGNITVAEKQLKRAKKEATSPQLQLQISDLKEKIKSEKL